MPTVTIGGSAPSSEQAAAVRTAFGIPEPDVIAEALATLVGTDQLIVMRAGAPYMATMTAVATYIAEVLELTPPAATAPAAITAGQWTLTAIAGGLRFGITTLPSDGGSALTDLEYSTNNGGAWSSFGAATTGNYNVTGLSEIEYQCMVRAVNAVGNGANSDMKAETPNAASGGTAEVLGGAATGDSGYGTTLAVTLPSGMENGCRLIVLTSNYGSSAVQSFSTGAWENITPVGGVGADRELWMSSAFATPPGALDIEFDGPSIHQARCFAVLTDSAAADPVVSFDNDATASGTTPRAHAYTTTQANSIVFGNLNFLAGGVTGGTGADSAHTWAGLATSAYDIAFCGVRATAGSYDATVGPNPDNSSVSDYWYVEIAGS